MLKSVYSVVLLTLAFSSGCAKLALVEKPKTPKVLDPNSSVKMPSQGQVFSVSYLLPQFANDYQEYRRLVDLADDPSLDRARLRRDLMINRIALDIDMNYRDYEANLFTGRAGYDVLGDALGIGLTLATTISKGERVKTVLGAVATAVSGDKLSIDKNFFREKTIEILITKMQASRDGVKKPIIDHIKHEDDVEQYPFEEAWSDLVDLFYAGTLQAAIQGLSADASLDAKQKATDKKTAKKEQ